MYPQLPGNFPQVIDSTIRSDFVSCQTKGYYSFFRKLGPKYPSIDLIAGGAFARGLEVTRKRYYGEGVPFEDALQEGMMEAIALYNLELKGAPIPESKDKKGLDRVVMALADYFTQYPVATDVIQPYMVYGKPSVEFTFSIPLPIVHPTTNEPLLYAGRFDMVGIYRNQLIGVDEKTTSQLGASWGNQWNLRGQFTGYCWALREYGVPVIGMMVRGVSFLAKSFGHVENLQMRSPWQIDAWYAQLLRDIGAMKEAYASGWYDQNFSDSCSAFGGCPFQKLCTSATPEDWVEGNYSPRDWNPLDKVPYAQPEVKAETINDELFKEFLARGE